MVNDARCCCRTAFTPVSGLDVVCLEEEWCPWVNHTPTGNLHNSYKNSQANIGVRPDPRIYSVRPASRRVAAAGQNRNADWAFLPCNRGVGRRTSY
jgi:hypothetical protein